MTKITIKPDCGNSPKNTLIRDFNIAFANQDIDFLVSHVTEEFHWKIIGDKEIHGKGEFKEALLQMKDYVSDEVVLENVISHGRAGCANGTLLFSNGEQFAFCDVYQFGNARGSSIRSLTSFVIKVK